MKQRIITAAMIIATLVLVFFAREVTTYVFDALIVGLSVIATFEMTKLASKSGLYNFKYVALCYTVIAYAVFIFSIKIEMEWYMVLLFQLAILIVLIGLLSLYGIIFRKKTENEIETRNLKIKVDNFSIYKAVHTLFVCVYPALLMLCFVAINNIGSLSYIFEVSTEIMPKLSLFMLILTLTIPVFVDTFAFFTGILIGGKKLCPKISPNKTISGTVGGIVWGILGALIAYLIFDAIPEYGVIFESLNFAFWQFIILGFVASVLSVLGDLFESYLKRKAGVKDAGDILPGHGGILDRMDSHIFCAPAMFIFLIIIL